MKLNINHEISFNFFLGLKILFFSSILSSCGYAFGGGAYSISKKVKTVQIDDFLNNSTQISPELMIFIQRKLRDFFQNRANLLFVKENGDIQIKGSVREYKLEFINPDPSKNMAQNSRILLKASIKYENKEEPEKNFDKEFQNDSNTAILGPGETLSDGKKHEKNIADNIALKIYEAIAHDW